MSDELQHECSRPPFEVPRSRVPAARPDVVSVPRWKLDRIATIVLAHGAHTQLATVTLWLYGLGTTGLLVALTDLGVAATIAFAGITGIIWLSRRKLRQQTRLEE